MAKRIGFSPLILLGDKPGDDTVIGGGTGQGGVNPGVVRPSYDSWLNSDLAYDYYPAGEGIDIDDYACWWLDQGFTAEEFEAANPGRSWNSAWYTMFD